MKKGIIFFLIYIILTFNIVVLAAPEDTEQDTTDGETTDTVQSDKPEFDGSKIKAENVMLIDAKTGLSLYELEADAQVYPASTTKIMTCLIALEEADMSETVTCGNEVEFPPEYSVMGLVPGEIVTIRDLIYGLMLISGNDAANAIAVYIGGTQNGFAKMMNAKALELGMTETHFVNANGAHDDNHFTTPRDMAKLAMYAYKNPDFMEIVGTTVHQPSDTNSASTKKVLDNTNHLIRDDVASFARYYNQYATGMKTGYTNQAGYCLIASASKENQDLIALIFNHENKDQRFTLANSLFDFGYQNYSQVDLSDLLKDSVIREPISNAKQDDPNGGYMDFIPNIEEKTYFSESNNFITDLITNVHKVNPMVDLDADLRAPIMKGEVYGKVIYEYKGRILTRCELVAGFDMLDYSTDYLTFEEDDIVEVAPPKDISTNNAPEWWWAIFPALLILFILYKVATYNRKKFKHKMDYSKYN